MSCPPHTCISRPQLLCELSKSGDLDTPYPPGELIYRIIQSSADCADEASLHARLRQIRQREMVRLAWRELSGAGNLAETMACVSELAEGCIRQALQYHHLWLSRRYGKHDCAGTRQAERARA